MKPQAPQYIMSLKRQGFFAILVDSQSGHFIRRNLSPTNRVRKLRESARTGLRKPAASLHGRVDSGRWDRGASKEFSTLRSTANCAVALVSGTTRSLWQST